MIHESNEVAKVEIEDVDLTFDKIYKKQYFPTDLMDEISKANALIIPYDEGFRERKEPLFPELTSEFFYYVKEAAKGTDAKIDICVSDEQFYELEMHADVVNIPMILLEYAVLPIVTGLISGYILEKIKVKRRNDPKIKVDLVVQLNGKSKKISYEGDADKFEETIKAINLLEE